jgi:hypothetical protein
MGCDSSSPLETYNVYPTTIPILSSSEIKQLQDEFRAYNNNEIGARLNRYGFIGNDTSIALPFVQQEKVLTSDDALRITMSAFLKNRKFTNTKNQYSILTSKIRLRDINKGKHWLVELTNQKCNGLEVLYSSIAAYIYCGRVYCIYNSWYPDAYVPDADIINPNDAKGRIIGYKIKIIGALQYNAVYPVDEKSIGEISKKVIFPYKTDNAIELRVAWQIPIHDSWWYVYMDTTTGEILGTDQLIVYN